MLLVTEGWKNFIQRLTIGERRFKKKAGNLLDGYKPENTSIDPRGMIPKAYIKVWGIPRTYCVDCAQTKLCSVNGIRTITEPQPQIDLEPLDVITYWICPMCNADEQMGGSLIVKDSDDDEVDSRDERRERTILAYISNMRAGGAEPTLLDGNLRRVNEDVR